MTANIGTPDRILRIIIGLALAAWYIWGGATGLWPLIGLIVGLVLIGTAAINFCPIYAALGMSTRSKG